MIRAGTDARYHTAPHRRDDARREQLVALAIDHVRPDGNHRQTIAQRCFAHHLFGGPLAASVIIVIRKRLKRKILGNVMAAGRRRDGAPVDRDCRNMDKRYAEPPRGLDGEPRTADVDAHELVQRGARGDERGGMDDRPDSGSHTRALPRRRVGHIANHRLGPKLCDHGSRMGANEGPHLLATATERFEHMRPHEPTGARDEDRHAGRTLGTVNGSATTRASLPGARTTAPTGTSRRSTARPIHRPRSEPPPSGSQAMLVTRPTSCSSCVTALHPAAGAAGGSVSNSKPRSWRFA